MYRLKKSLTQQGTAGVMALVALAFLSVMGTALMSLTTTELEIACEFRDGIMAQYLAEAAVVHALVKLKSDPIFVNNTAIQSATSKNTLIPYSGTFPGTYKVIVTGSGVDRTITAISSVSQYPPVKRVA
ncbi:hypothetical protein [Dendrosporobacter sp. 1207_IL3150]|uniref:hypothetical protein n=1 Tax=Dendrosporobacter sp. 1207_IL3150 TaxID=3084054 RepID=UPI002FDAB090